MSVEARSNLASDKDKQWTGRNWQSFYAFIKKLGSMHDRILDVGCGSWELMVVKNDPKTVGLDISRVHLLALKKGGFRGEAVLGDCEHLPFIGRLFDLALSNQVIEHMLCIGDVTKVISEMERVSENIAVITPNAMLHYRINDPTHFLFFTPRSLRRVVHNCEVYGTGQVMGLLSYWFLYDSPNIRKLPFVGRLIYEGFLRLDYSGLMQFLSGRLWHGNQLIALRKTMP